MKKVSTLASLLSLFGLISCKESKPVAMYLGDSITTIEKPYVQLREVPLSPRGKAYIPSLQDISHVSPPGQIIISVEEADPAYFRAYSVWRQGKTKAILVYSPTGTNLVGLKIIQ